MATFKGILLVTTIILGLITVPIQAFTYNVVAEPPQNTNVIVMVDEVAFPLKPEHGIIYKGEAPSAKSGYHYAFVDSANNKISEPFQRPPLLRGSSTLNDFFNRSSNTYNLKTLPQTLPPLKSINRIKSDLHIKNQIPTIHIYGNQSEIDKLHDNQLEDLDFKLNVAYIGLKDVQIFNDVKVSLAGSNTRRTSKLSYALKLDKKSSSTLFGYKNIKLRSLVRDPSYVRENVCNNVLEACGLITGGFSYVRLFINNQAVGLFGLVETFQGSWTTAVFANGDNSYKAGNLYQGIGANYAKVKNFTDIVFSDLHYEPSIEKYNAGQYKIKSGPNKKDIEPFKGLQRFTKFINESLIEGASQVEWGKVLNVEGFLRAIALGDLLGLTDSYPLSNNYFLYEDPKQHGQMIFIQADFDTTLGRTFFNTSIYTSGNYAEHPNLLFRPLTKAVLANSNYLNFFKSIHYTLAKVLVNPEVLNPYIDSIIDMIRPDVEWDLGLKRVGKTLQLTPLEIKKIFDSFNAPGFSFNMEAEKPVVAPLDVAVGSDFVNDYSLSVKDYISRKSSAVQQFYNAGHELETQTELKYK